MSDNKKMFNWFACPSVSPQEGFLCGSLLGHKGNCFAVGGNDLIIAVWSEPIEDRSQREIPITIDDSDIDVCQLNRSEIEAFNMSEKIEKINWYVCNKSKPNSELQCLLPLGHTGNCAHRHTAWSSVISQDNHGPFLKEFNFDYLKTFTTGNKLILSGGDAIKYFLFGHWVAEMIRHDFLRIVAKYDESIPEEKAYNWYTCTSCSIQNGKQVFCKLPASHNSHCIGDVVDVVKVAIRNGKLEEVELTVQVAWIPDSPKAKKTNKIKLIKIKDLDISKYGLNRNKIEQFQLGNEEVRR